MQMTTEPNPKPTREQLRVLRTLADQRGESFTYPHTSDEADAEIERLRGRQPSSRVEQYVDRRAVGRDMAQRGGATAIRDEEIVGYGSSAHWAVGQ